MKKSIVCLLLVLALALSMIGCTAQPAPEASAPVEAVAAEEPQEAAAAPETDNNTSSLAELVLITDANSVDDRGFNQFSWEGLKQYAEENGKTYNYYRPIDQSTESYMSAIESAAKNGAKVIVTAGFLFSPAIYEAQTAYPDVRFVFIDGTPASDAGDSLIADNTYCVFFAEEQSGFLAGYAAVNEGYNKLGFFGAMAVPAVVRFGYGYVQGAEYAAKELGMDAGSVEMLYTYTGSFDNTPEFQTKAAAWYQTGTQCIFGCGAPDNVFAACESVGGDCVAIGVDTDMSAISDTCMTSAMKKLAPVVYDAIDQYYKGTFPGGTVVTCDITANAVGLPMDTSRFQKFTNEQYDAIVAKMVADTDGIVSKMLKDSDASGNAVTVETLTQNLSCVNFKFVD